MRKRIVVDNLNRTSLNDLIIKLNNSVKNSLATMIIDYEGLIIYSTVPETENMSLLAVFVREIVSRILSMIDLFGANKINTVVIRVDKYAFHIFPLEKIIGVVIARRS